MLSLYGNKVKRMLDTQYRANEVLMNFSSNELYDGKLQSHSSVKDRLLIDLKGVLENDDTRSPLVFYDTSGFDMRETSEEATVTSRSSGVSKFNQGEADIVLKHVEDLIEAGVDEAEIAIISPYNAQVSVFLIIGLASENNDKVETPVDRDRKS
jgi:DNA polymerase alpha-associated DNA helicase A